MSDEVSSFLRDVEQLKGRRNEEDEARSRELEEKILQERRERQARREERARSISPQKSSPANTPPPSSHRNRASSILDGPSLEPRSSPAPGSPPSTQSRPRVTSDVDDTNTMSSADFKENESPFDADSKRSSVTATSSAGQSSSRALSWQRRPTSQASERPKSRPLSVMAAENAAARSSTTVSDQSDGPVSRDQISQALSAKDPSWFRQTPDRGQNSAAYRRNQVEDEDRMDMSSMKTELPGMSRLSPTEPDKFSSDRRPSSPAISGKFGGSPLTLTAAQRLDPPGINGSAERETSPQERQPIMSPPLGRTSPTRSTSPTKGMGGFVQSAMMKRTDSVKRWSVSSPQGLQRADSVASSRTGTPQPQSRPASTLRSGTLSRPGSSHGDDAAPIEDAVQTPSADTKQQEEDVAALPVSPSKTMDPRRWSPTKSSSWLEAQLNKPESPKPKPTPPASNQPAWMVELNKAKAQKANNPSSDIGRTSSVKHAVNVGGLLRSSPMGTNVKPTPLPGAFPAAAASVGRDKAPISELRSGLNKAAPEDEAAERPVSSHGKVKPDTPPKKDFRANLKPSHQASKPSVGSMGGDANELKNVFGTLRRAKTQNYVAPDELKDNITRGKAELNVTGGVQTRVRKDEFKDAILQKKTDFQKAQMEGRGVTRAARDPTDKPVPEGVAKRLEMSRTGGAIHSRGESKSSDISPDQPARSVSASNAPKRDSREVATKSPPPTISPKPEKFTSPATSPPKEQMMARSMAASSATSAGAAKAGGGRLADRFNPGLAGLLARGPPGMGPGPSKSPELNASHAGSASVGDADQPPAPGPQLTHMTKGRARGPRRKAPTSMAKPSDEAAAQPSPSLKSAAASPASAAIASPPLASPPKSASLSAKSPGLGGEQAMKSPPPISLAESRFSRDVVQLVDSSKQKQAVEAPVKSLGTAISLVGNSSSNGPASPPPSLSPTKKIHDQVAAVANRNKQVEEQPAPVERADEPVSQPSSPKKGVLKRMSKFFDESGQQLMKGDTSEPPSPIKPLSPQKTGGRRLPEPPSPIKPLSPQKTGGRQLPEPIKPLSPQKTGGRQLPEPPSSPPKQGWEDRPALGHSRSRSVKDAAAMFQVSASASSTPAAGSSAVFSPQPSVDSVSLRSRSRSPTKSASARPLPIPPPKESASAAVSPSLPPSLASPSPQRSPVSRQSAAVSPSFPPPVASPSPQRSPTTKQSDEVTAMLDEFFGPNRMYQRNYKVDAAEVLMNKPSEAAAAGKTRTLSAQLFRIGEDGKKQAVPAHQERVLFEREMYLCSHTFTEDSGRKSTEVYFWLGDEVPQAMAEGAHVSVNREARALGASSGKLIKLTQGKETAGFVQALGGVLIVRRGSSNKYDSLASNMLCGRRFQGQIAFDEVDFSPQSLSSGFPYLITQAGKCFLWTGKGSDVEELSCARLIGMESALMGELVEVEDGNEPASFWDIFGNGMGATSRPGSADHWRLKPNYRKYCGRLFRSDASSKQQITEIHPFSQADLDPAGIYVLDAFFELYIVVGYGSSREYPSYCNALEFAQEYAILAASMEDRPFMPISTVVIEGIPRDLKSVFRKWRDAANPTKTNPSAASSRATSPLASPVPGGGKGLRRARSLRIVPLNAALMALNGEHR